MTIFITRQQLEAADRDGFILMQGGRLILKCPYLPPTEVEALTPSPSPRIGAGTVAPGGFKVV
jgi:hypothetical protein